MGTWLRRLLGLPPGQPDRQQAQARDPVAQHTSAVAPQAQDGVTSWPLPTATDALFFQSLIANSRTPESASPAAEKAILDALERHRHSGTSSSDLIPRVPAVIPHLLQSLRDENMSGRALAKEIARDITLVSEVLRQANSSMYHLREPVTSIEKALLVLGKNTLRLLIAKAAFRPLINIQSGRFTRTAAPYLWDQSDKCALACRLLAQEEGVDPFAAFLAGLMQNVGMILAFRLADQVVDGSTLPASEPFRDSFLQHARRLSAQTATQWDLPPAIRQVLSELSAEETGQRSTLTAVVHAGDQLSKLRILINQGHLSDQGAQLTAQLPPRAVACLQQLNQTAGE